MQGTRGTRGTRGMRTVRAVRGSAGRAGRARQLFQEAVGEEDVLLPVIGGDGVRAGVDVVGDGALEERLSGLWHCGVFQGLDLFLGTRGSSRAAIAAG